MIEQVRSGAILLIGLFIGSNVNGQEIDYQGYRLALFDFSIVQAKPRSVDVTCRIANTGSSPCCAADHSKSIVLELDTFNLPPLLWGHEASITDAARRQLPMLPSGKVSSKIWLKILTPSPELPVGTGCVDLGIDTVLLLALEKMSATFAVIVRNHSTQWPATLVGDAHPFQIDAYFTGGEHLTRGSIPAGSAQAKLGVNTLNGVLPPTQKMQLNINVSLENRSKFNPNIVFVLALPQNIQDCQPGNNQFVRMIK